MKPAVKTLVAAALLAAASAHAAEPRSTVCTITVNSDDERETFRRHLPAERFDFVELVERGRPDWLASACRKQVRCDVLVVSGHFAGTEFYGSKPQTPESLPVDEIERVACSDGCPTLFSHLKEVYLFGCDTLKAEPVKSATPELVRHLVRAGMGAGQAEAIGRSLSERHAESSRERMRRAFPGVPVIYGFQSLAPYGRVAGPMLHQHFLGGAGEVGTGRPSSRLLALFGPASMVTTSGMRDSDPLAPDRDQACRFHDDRLTLAKKIDVAHALLGGRMPEVRMTFDRVEKLLGSIGTAERASASVGAALRSIAADRGARDRYLEVARETVDPALRVRMIALARSVEWLTLAEQRAELGRLVGDMVAGNGVGFGEVDLICALNADRALDAELHRVASKRTASVANAAALACMGSDEGRARVRKALASPDEHEVQLAQAYFRHRPMTDAAELRAATLDVARMPGSTAQVRALDTLARHRIADREIVDALAGLFRRANSLAVQRAIAEVFLRADVRAVAPPDLAATLARHRIKSTGGPDLIDVLVAKLGN